MSDPPPTNFTSFSKKIKNKNKIIFFLDVTSDMWHMTYDIWHMTHDTWHMTRDIWHVTCDPQGVWRGGPMRGLGSGHVTCGEDLSNARRCLLHRGHTNPQTNKHADGHRDSMTELAQWADSVKSWEWSLIKYLFLERHSLTVILCFNVQLLSHEC